MYGIRGLRKGIYGPEVSHWRLADSRLGEYRISDCVAFRIIYFSLLTFTIARC
jgi:hypothetical protein